MTNSNTFKSKLTLEQRKAESLKIRTKYPDKIPIICEVSKDIVLDKNKYLVPNDLTAGQFIYVIRKKMKLLPEQSVFIFINKTLPPSGELLSEIYKSSKDEDGFLYIYVAMESTFG